MSDAHSLENQQRPLTFFASAPKGVEDLLEEEVLQYGEIEKKSAGGIKFKAIPIKALEFLLRTRLASRVFLQIECYYIESEKDLYERAVEKWWHQVFKLNQTFKITTHVDGRSRQKFTNDLYLSRLLKDAIADSFRDEFDGKRPSVDTRSPDIVLALRVEKSKKRPGFTATISLDLCGKPLSNRGYRESGHSAPLRENLAAAIAQISLNQSESHTKPLPTYDLMCGSGTLLLEMAMIQIGVAPSFLNLEWSIQNRRRPFHFLNHLWFEHLKLSTMAFSLMNQIVEESRHNLKICEKWETFIFGSDQDNEALEQTRRGFESLGIPKNLYQLQNRVMSETKKQTKEGVILLNPPYGKRLEEIEELANTYQMMGDTLKNDYSDLTAYILTSEPTLSKEIGLKSTRKFPLFNGNLDCRLLEYKLYK